MPYRRHSGTTAADDVDDGDVEEWLSTVHHYIQSVVPAWAPSGPARFAVEGRHFAQATRVDLSSRPLTLTICWVVHRLEDDGSASSSYRHPALVPEVRIAIPCVWQQHVDPAIVSQHRLWFGLESALHVGLVM